MDTQVLRYDVTGLVSVFMSTKRLLLISLLVTTIYSAVSAIYFFTGMMDPISTSALKRAFEWFIILPSALVFGVGFGSGESAALLSALLMFLLIWICSIPVVALLYPLYRRVRTKWTELFGTDPIDPRKSP